MFASRTRCLYVAFRPSYRTDELIEEICCSCHARYWHDYDVLAGAATFVSYPGVNLVWRRS